MDWDVYVEQFNVEQFNVEKIESKKINFEKKVPFNITT